MRGLIRAFLVPVLHVVPAARAAEAEYDARVIGEDEANALLEGDLVVRAVGVLKVVALGQRVARRVAVKKKEKQRNESVAQC